MFKLDECTLLINNGTEIIDGLDVSKIIEKIIPITIYSFDTEIDELNRSVKSMKFKSNIFEDVLSIKYKNENYKITRIAYVDEFNAFYFIESMLEDKEDD